MRKSDQQFWEEEKAIRNKEDREYFTLMKGQEYERDGDIEEAIQIYESLIKNHCDAQLSYDRLCIIYRKQKDFYNEERVLNTAISRYTKLSSKGYDWCIDAVAKYKERLNKLHTKMEKLK